MVSCKEYTEQDILSSFQKGEEKGFSCIFEKHYDALYYYARSIIKDKDIADDILQDAFLELWKRRAQFDALVPIKSYLYKMVHYGCLDHLRKKARLANEMNEEGPREISDDFVLHRIIRSEVWNEIHSLIGFLPPAVSKVMHMLYNEGKSVREIARELNRSVNTIKKQKAQGIAMLKKKKSGFFISLLIPLLQKIV